MQHSDTDTAFSPPAGIACLGPLRTRIGLVLYALASNTQARSISVLGISAKKSMLCSSSCTSSKGYVQLRRSNATANPCVRGRCALQGYSMVSMIFSQDVRWRPLAKEQTQKAKRRHTACEGVEEAVSYSHCLSCLLRTVMVLVAGITERNDVGAVTRFAGCSGIDEHTAQKTTCMLRIAALLKRAPRRAS